MENGNNNQVSWKVLGVVAVVALGLVLGIVYVEYIQTDSEETNQYNQTDTEKTNKQINQPPTAEFTATPASGDAPLKVTFNASDSFDEDGEITNYDWDFGDVTASGETVMFTYESYGSYSVKLVVKDDEGATNSFSREIEVTSGKPEGTVNSDKDVGDKEEEKPLSTYEIVQEQDISVRYDEQMAKRMKYYVVVGTEIERKQIKPTIKEIISNIRRDDEDIDSISVFLYTTENRVGNVAYDVAKADWAPDGEVGNLTGRIVSENIRDDYEIKLEIKENLKEYLRKIKEQDIKFGLTVEERKEVFNKLVRCEDRGDIESSKYYDPMCSGCPEYREENWQAKGNMSDEIIRSCKREVRDEYGITEDQQDKISSEGLEKRWPMPDPLPFADCCDY